METLGNRKEAMEVTKVIELERERDAGGHLQERRMDGFQGCVNEEGEKNGIEW